MYFDRRLTVWRRHRSHSSGKPSPTMTFPLLELANELIDMIVSHIDDIDTLRSFALTCSRLQYLTELELYRSVFQRTGKQAINLLAAITSREERAQAIHVIDSRCKSQHRDGLVSMAPVIGKAKNLKQLTIESPYCNGCNGRDDGDWNSTMYELLLPVYDIWSTNTLPRLTKCMLHVTISKGVMCKANKFA